MKRYLLVSDECGVFLGEFLGLGFWSKLDGAGQDCACTFDSEADVAAFLATWKSQPDFDVHTIAVEVSGALADNGVPYATMDECAAVGVERWTP